jgi:hypothetical protein
VNECCAYFIREALPENPKPGEISNYAASQTARLFGLQSSACVDGCVDAFAVGVVANAEEPASIHAGVIA